MIVECNRANEHNKMEPRLIALKLFLAELDITELSETNDEYVQRLIYLGQLTGADLGYRFSWYSSGPLDSDLTKSYSALIDAIALGRDTCGHLLNPNYRQKLQKIKPLLAPPVLNTGVVLTRETWLELLACYDYLQRVSHMTEVDAWNIILDRGICFSPYKDCADSALQKIAEMRPKTAVHPPEIASPEPTYSPEAVRGCLFTGPGRGDCSHYIGLPEKEDETTTDEYGRPYGWCEVCWRGELISRLVSYIQQVSLNYGGETYAQNATSEAKKYHPELNRF